MNLMIVKDVVLTKSGQAILTGPLLLKEFVRKSEIEQKFGGRVMVSSVDGEEVLVPVKGVSVSQGLSGAWQVSLLIGCPGGLRGVALESFVASG